MKKLLFALSLCFLLCSCTHSEIEPRLCGITFRAEMKYYNESFSFEGELGSKGELVALITAPKELEDLKLTLTGEETRVEYKGLSYTPQEGTMPFSALLEDFYAPLSQIIAQGLVADGNGKLKVGRSRQTALLTLSPLGLPQELDIPDEGLFVSFYNVSVKEDVND